MKGFVLAFLLGLSTTINTAPTNTTTDSTIYVEDCPKNDSTALTFPNSNDCNKYYQCQNGTKTELSCPLGQQYNAQLKTCDDPKYVGCKGPLLTTTAPQEGTNNTSVNITTISPQERSNGITIFSQEGSSNNTTSSTTIAPQDKSNSSFGNFNITSSNNTTNSTTIAPQDKSNSSLGNVNITTISPQEGITNNTSNSTAIAPQVGSTNYTINSTTIAPQERNSNISNIGTTETLPTTTTKLEDRNPKHTKPYIITHGYINQSTPKPHILKLKPESSESVKNNSTLYVSTTESYLNSEGNKSILGKNENHTEKSFTAPPINTSTVTEYTKGFIIPIGSNNIKEGTSTVANGTNSEKPSLINGKDIKINDKDDNDDDDDKTVEEEDDNNKESKEEGSEEAEAKDSNDKETTSP